MKGKESIMSVAGMILASAVLAGCQSSRSNYQGGMSPGTGVAQNAGWNNSSSGMARQGSTTGMSGGTTVSQNGATPASGWNTQTGVIGSYPGTGSNLSGGQGYNTGGSTMTYPASGTGATRTSGMSSGTGMGYQTPGYTRDTYSTGTVPGGSTSMGSTKFDQIPAPVQNTGAAQSTAIPAATGGMTINDPALPTGGIAAPAAPSMTSGSHMAAPALPAGSTDLR